MKVKLSQIITSQDAYMKLLDESYLPIKIKYYLSTDAPKISLEIQKFNQLKDDLIRKYGKTSKDGQTISVDDPENDLKNKIEFQREINELGGVDVELEMDMIPEEVLINNDKCSLTAKDLFLLRGVFSKPMVKEIDGDKKNE